MYYDEILETADDSSFIHNRKSTEVGRKTDKTYEIYSLPVNKILQDGKFHKTVTIANYGSGQQGTRIRNAVTGERYDHLVGSKSEDLYFKVIDSMARFNRKDPLILFYDTPDQYENHHFTSLSNSVKEKWYEKCLESRTKLIK